MVQRWVTANEYASERGQTRGNAKRKLKMIELDRRVTRDGCRVVEEHLIDDEASEKSDIAAWHDEQVKSSALETQVGGEHYKNMNIQPLEFILANELPFAEGAIIQYVCRHREKNGREDLEKAKHYIDILIEHLYASDK